MACPSLQQLYCLICKSSFNTSLVIEEFLISIVERNFNRNCSNIEYLIEPTLIIVGTIFIAIRNCLRVALRKKFAHPNCEKCMVACGVIKLHTQTKLKKTYCTEYCRKRRKNKMSSYIQKCLPVHRRFFAFDRRFHLFFMTS